MSLFTFSDNTKKLFDYIFKTNWKKTLILIIINLASYLYKFITYRGLTSYISDLTESKSVTYNLLVYLFKLIFLHIVQNITYFFLRNEVKIRLKDIFLKLVNRLMYYKIDFYDTHNRDDFIQLWDYFYNVENIIREVILDLPRNVIYLCYYTYTIYSFSYKVLITTILFNIFMIKIMSSLLKKQVSIYKKKLEVKNVAKQKFFEAIENINIIKNTCTEEYEIKRIINPYDKYYKLQTKESKLEIINNSLNYIINDIIMMIIYIFGFVYIFNNTLKPIELMYIAVHTGNFYSNLLNIKQLYNNFKLTYPKIDKVFEILNYNKIENIYYKSNESNNKINSDYKIVIKNLSFSYDVKDVFKNISINIKKNKLNIILGKNGCGKSTLIKLLFKYYTDYEGNIYYDNINIKNLSINKIRKKMSLVTQKPFLFNESVEYNIKYGINNSDNLNNILNLLKIKNWYTLNKDKKVGSFGNKLSGGQIKRIQICNSLLTSSEIIILDEPTNSLDIETIDWLTKFFNNNKIYEKKTYIIITHDNDFLNKLDKKFVSVYKFI